MGRARPIVIDTKSFPKAGDAQAFFSGMLAGYGSNDRVNDEDAAHLAALLKRHDEHAEKMGSGIDYFVVAPAPDYPDQRCFWIVRNDGTRVDFSYKHCLEKKAGE